MLSLYEILKASKTGIAPDMWTALAGKNWGGKDSGAEVKELTGIPPLSFTADGTPLLDYLISGNMSQTGTPTPQNPIQPSECGDKTANLFDISVIQTEGTANYYLTEDGTETSGVGWFITQYIPVNGDNIIISGPAGTNPSICAYDENKQYLRGKKYNGSNATISIQDAKFVRFSLVPTSEPHQKAMLNYGTTILPFEPYGYKIPISSGGTTTPVYLGEVETTRKIYKMRLTNPSNTTETPNGYRLAFSISSHRAPSYQSGGGICNITTWNGDYNIIGFVASNQKVFITQNIAEWATKEGAVAWLDEHEVYIWYVLATEETGIVNEPLMKIGEYADSLTATQAGVEIPTNNGSTTIDVETAVKPSEIYIKYKG